MRSRPVSRGRSLQPCIAELLRTCVYPPSLVLRVERILEENVEESRLEDQAPHDVNDNDRRPRKSAYRLFLGDGEIMVQALLAAHLHPLIDLQETTEGSLIELRDYSIRKAKRQCGEGDVIYLGVENYVCISLSRPTTSEAHKDVLANGGGFMMEENTRIAPQQALSYIQVPSSPPAQDMPLHRVSSRDPEGYETVSVDSETVIKSRQALQKLSSNPRQKRRRENEDEGTRLERPKGQIDEPASSQESDTFETVEVDLDTTRRRRLALHELTSNVCRRRKRREEDEATSTLTKRPKLEAEEATLFEREMSATFSITQPRLVDASAPLHTLDSLLHPPNPLPTRNYPVSVFAVISWISPTIVHRPGSPFPPRRTLKLHDPSITSRQVGVSISVFIDAVTFTPRHSTIALLSGVVMQMYRDEVILNAYPSLRGSEWYIDKEDKLESMGYDVQGMRDWWETRRRERASARPDS